MISRRGATDREVVRRAGFTIVELLTVLVILSILGGLSAGVYQAARRNFTLSASASRVEALLLQARNTAVTAGIPVRVVVKPSASPDSPSTVTAYAFERLGEWSFEAELGLFNEPIELLNGAELSASAGHVGSGLAPGGGHVDCGTSSRFDVRAGLHLEAWVFLAERSGSSPSPRRRSRTRRSRRRRSSTAEGRAGAVVAKGKAFFLGVTDDGVLEGAIGDYRLRTGAGVVLSGMWTRVTLRFDGSDVVLLADGIERAASLVGYEDLEPSKRPGPPALVPLDPGSVTIGAPAASFQGSIDEVRLYGLIEPQEHVLGAREHILGWKKVIHFDRRGHLDARFHERPVRLLIYGQPLDVEASPGGTRVFRDYSKTFLEWANSRGIDLAQEKMTEAGEERKLEEQLDASGSIDVVIDRIGSVR